MLNAVAPKLPELIGGSADLTGSNLTYIKGSGAAGAGQWSERNFHFGVREHAMGAVLNGIAYDAQNDRIFVTGKQWKKLFEIKLTGPKNQ